MDGRASTSNVARVAKSATGSASRLAWTVRSALHLALGAAPAASGGVTLQLAVRRGWLRLGVEGRFDARSSEDLAGQAAVDAMFVGGALLGCGHWRWLYGCAAVTLGALSGGGRGLVDAQRVSTVYFAPGLRAGLDVPLFWRLFGYGFAQLDVLAVRARYLESTTQAQLWRAPPVAAAFGIGVGVRVW